MLVYRGTLVLLVAVLGVCAAQRKLPRTHAVTAEVKTGVNFDCPEEFGYYPHPTDCTQYYVCVFGGALLESCTGGLMYSHELQTCDWPRNVGCDATGEVSTVAATAPSASTQQHRQRYTPPPPPPQPAAIVTSRGQPRQLHQQHQQQQEIIKQQQLYEDAEETLPPAEEIESDRQQRVYRGQPSTIGQVQRDRDGLRNSNAIPTYSGRAEKIGIISFGTGQQSAQPIQQYSPDLTNDLRRRRRRKRQAPSVPRSRPSDGTPWYGKMAFAIARPSPHPHALIIQPQGPHHSPHPPQLSQSSIHKFLADSSNYQPDKKDEFQPFIPSYQQRPQNQRGFGQIGKPKQKPKNENFAFFNLQYVSKEVASTTLKYPQYITLPGLVASENKAISFGFPKENSNFDHFGTLDVYNSKMKETEAITQHYQGVNHKPEQNRDELDFNEQKQNMDTNSTQIKPELNIEEVLERIRANQKAKINQTLVTHSTTLRPLRSSILNDEYYYYDYEDEDDYDAKSIYISHKTPSKIKPLIQTTQTASGLADDEEYYYEEYDYPESIPVNSSHDKMKWEMKYSSRYSEKLQNTKTTTQVSPILIRLSTLPNYNSHEQMTTVPNLTTLKPSLSPSTKSSSSVASKTPSSKLKHYITKSPLPGKTPGVFSEIVPTTAASIVPKNTVRQRQRKTTTRPTVVRHRLKSRHRQTTKVNDHDARLDDKTANRVEVTSAGPSQSSSAVTAATRALYNSSRYNDPQFDPYYNLYEDDVELYRDVDYSHQQYNGNTYRGTPTPVVQTVQTSTTDEPKRGSSYYQQDIYQQSNVGDYNQDNRFNSQIDEQSYRQPTRQQVRAQNQNEEVPIRSITSTTATSPRPVTSIYLSTTPLARSDANHTRAQSLLQANTLPDNLGHTLPSSSFSTSTSTITNTTTVVANATILTNLTSVPGSDTRRLDNNRSAIPVTYRPKYAKLSDTFTDASFAAPVRSAVVNKPAPFTSSTTTDKPLVTYYLTKAFKSTLFSNVDNFSPRPAEYLKRKLYYIRNTEPSPAMLTAPTTYAPPKFFLKSLLNTSDADMSQEYVIKSNGIKTIRKYINPIAINNVFASSTELYPVDKSTEDLSSERERNLSWRGKAKFLPVTTYRQSDPLQISSTTTTTARTTSKPTTPTPPVVRSREQFRHYVEPFYSQQQAQSTKFRNTIEAPRFQQILSGVDDDDEPLEKPIPDELPSYKPRPSSSTSTTSTTSTTTTSTTIPRVVPTDFSNATTTVPLPDFTRTPLPAVPVSPSRVSRVNAAIKSMIGLGAARGRPKCSEAKCSESKQRTQTQLQSGRTRGSAHYTANTANTANAVNQAEAVNRGTPPPRSRPTLKPSTSIVSKAQEFIDIYRFPPRRPDTIYPQPQPDKTAAKCRKDVCLLPDCSCGGKEIPGDIPVEQVPQIVLLTFDDSVNDLNKGLYSDLFDKGRVNPNGCPIAATFYVSHEWTDYSQVQNLYSDGHELASHTVSHSFGEQFSQKKWTKEVAGQREILSAYGGVKLEDVRGMRAPFLSVGGNKMFKMLYDSNFTYDSSMPIYENKPPSWPYTLDYKLFHDCMIPPCPTRSYPGVWEVPMVMWQDLNGGRCSMGDACSNPSESEGVFKMLMKNFDRHYTTNRAPFGLFYHAAWFTQPHHKAGFIQFLDTINQMKDVFLVTNWQAIQWVRDPTPMSRINNFQPFQCNYADRPKRCNNPKVCNLWHKSGVRYMRTCQPCPDIYPWTGNTGIRSSRIDNDIED